jgi:TonB family protein
LRSTWLLTGLLAFSGAAYAQEAAAPAGEQAAPEGTLTKPPALTKFVEATYPASALAEGKGARVVLDLVLDDQGQVEEANVLQSGGPAFDEAAITAVYQFVFSPAEIDGTPASVRLQYEYVFAPKTVVEVVDAPTDTAVGALTGRLLEKGTRKPLVGLRVVLEGIDREAFSDAKGVFRFDDVPAGEVSVFVDDEIYESIVDTETVEAGQLTDVLYYVEKTGFDEDSVTVVGRRPRKEVTRRTLSVQEIRTIPGTSGDALKVVQNLPGAARIPFGAGNIILRGGGLSQAFVDAMPIPAAFHFGGLRSTIASALIETIDVYPGNFDVEYGRINGGVVDVRLRAPASDGFHGYIEADVFDAGFMVEGPIAEHHSIAIAGRRSYIDGVLAFVIPDDAPTQFTTAPRYYDGQILYEYKRGKNRVRGLLYGSNDKIVATIKEPPDTNPLISGNASFEQSFLGGQVQWERRINEQWSNDAQFSYYLQPIEAGVGPFGFELNVHVLTLRDKLNYKLSETLELTAGVDTDLVIGDVNGSGGGPPSEGENRGSGANQTIKSFDQGFRFTTPALWLRADWKVGPVQIVPGMRAEYFGAVEALELQPRLTVRYQLAEPWVVKGGVGMFAEQVNGAFTSNDLGNPNLDVESSVHYSLGVEHSFTEALSLDVTGFYKTIDDMVRPIATEPNYVNSGIGRAYGLEVLLRHELTERFYGWVAYTLMRSERRDAPGEDWRVFDSDQTHNLVVIGQYKLTPTWQFGLRWRYVTGNPTTPVVGGIFNANSGTYDQRYGENNSTRLDDFHQLDLRIDKLWTFDTWQLVTYLEVQNVYNRANPEGVSYNYDFTESQNTAGLPIIPSFGIRGQF